MPPMNRVAFSLSVVLCVFCVETKAADKPVATYSIVAFDPATGDLGIAVQSKFFGVGSVVPWAKAGVGAVATQSYANTTYGPKGLELMAAGKSLNSAARCAPNTSNDPEVIKASHALLLHF